ncbi:MAG: hypothetical protein P8X65_07805 [Syntrophobacterales bacterium]|jgi:hypothetical protein
MSEKQGEPGRPLRDETPVTGTGVKRPLVVVVLALMVGLAAAAWGLKVSGTWLVIGLAGLLAVLFLVYGLGPVGGSQSQRRDGQEEPK